MMEEKVVKWRQSPFHRKCQFCKYLKFISCRVTDGEGYFLCRAKDKIILCVPDMTEISRPFCKLFELDMEKRI